MTRKLNGSGDLFQIMRTLGLLPNIQPPTTAAFHAQFLVYSCSFPTPYGARAGTGWIFHRLLCIFGTADSCSFVHTSSYMYGVLIVITANTFYFALITSIPSCRCPSALISQFACISIPADSTTNITCIHAHSQDNNIYYLGNQSTIQII
jgi:hypothetical protein